MILLFTKVKVAYFALHFEPYNLNNSGSFSKYWNAYIDKFIVKRVLSGEKFVTNMIYYIKRFYDVNILSILANRMITSQDFNQKQITINETEMFFNTVMQIHAQVKDLVIHWATGKIYLYSHLDPKKARVPHIFYYQVNKKLMLNLTFFVLKFYRNINYCSVAGLEIWTASSCIKGFGSPEYVYCRQYATFNLYPNMNDLCVKEGVEKVHNTIQVFFELDLKFSVIDNGLMTTHKMDHLNQQITNISNIYAFHSYKLISQDELFSYIIRVRKNYQIIFSSIYQNCLLFDGPGFEFPIVEQNKRGFVTSTFQCVLLYSINNNILYFKNSVAFSSKRTEPLWHYNVTKENVLLDFPREGCQKMVCIVHVQSQYYYQVNFTIEKIFSWEPFGGGCLFWGLVVVEDTHDNYEESLVLCNNIDNVPGRSFYSQNSNLLIIIYTYKN